MTRSVERQKSDPNPRPKSNLVKLDLDLGQGPNRILVRDQIAFGLVTKTHLGQELNRIWVRGQTL